MDLLYLSGIWNISAHIPVAWAISCILCVFQWSTQICGIMETIPAYGQQQSCRYLCWTAQVNTAVHFLWSLFCYFWPILGSLFAYTCSNWSSTTAAMLWPLHSRRSAGWWRETSECIVLFSMLNPGSWNL